jgi:hypothetical protein
MQKRLSIVLLAPDQPHTLRPDLRVCATIALTQMHGTWSMEIRSCGSQRPHVACASSWSSGADSNDVGVQTLEAIDGSPEMKRPLFYHIVPRLIAA